jgi:MFS transporter, DHA2 family, methylenomycin A resistance protein
VFLLQPDPPSTARRRENLALAAICLGFLLITLDTTIVNVALGPIVADLGGSLAGAQWVVSAYTLAFAALLLSAGALADRVGARRSYIGGVAIFALGSVLCALAPSLGALIAARALQGVWAGVSGVGVAAGPVLGGLLVGTLGWRAIFAVNPPLAVAIVIAVALTVEETPRRRQRLDPLGQILAVAALGALVAGFILAGERGWGASATVGPLASGAVLAAGFVTAERRVERPMVSPELFRRPAFGFSVGIAGIFNFALYGALFCLSLALHLGRGLSPMETGLALLPATVTLGVTAFLSARVIARIGEWRAIAIGLGMGALGAALMAAASGSPTGLLIAASLPLGLVSLAMPAMTAVALTDVAAARVGCASGVLNGARQAGGAFGVAVLGSLLGTGAGISLRPAMATVAVAYLLGLALTAAGSRARTLTPATARKEEK